MLWPRAQKYVTPALDISTKLQMSTCRRFRSVHSLLQLHSNLTLYACVTFRDNTIPECLIGVLLFTVNFLSISTSLGSPSAVAHSRCSLSVVRKTQHGSSVRSVRGPNGVISSLSLLLRPTVSRPVCLGIKHPSGPYDQIFITVRQLLVC
jgi:hypothetical protein